METNLILYNRIYDLKKKIHTWEWDVSIMEDGDRRNQKQKELQECKKTLEQLEGLYRKTTHFFPEQTIRR